MKDSTGSAAAVVLEAAMIAGDACGKVQAASAESSEASFVLCAVYLEEVRGQATLAESEVLRLSLIIRRSKCKMGSKRLRISLQQSIYTGDLFWVA